MLNRLRASRSEEYFAIVEVVSAYDARFLTIKNWAVTVSLTGAGVGFTVGHYSLFLLSAVSAMCFWIIEALSKQHQTRYYRRMRQLEYEGASDSEVGFAPQVDWAWGKGPDRGDPRTIKLRDTKEMKKLRLKAWVLPWVFLPYALAAGLGIALFIMALQGVFGPMSI